MFRAVHGDGRVATDELEQSDQILFLGGGTDGLDDLQPIFLVTAVADKMFFRAATISKSCPAAIMTGHFPGFSKVVQFFAAAHTTGALSSCVCLGGFRRRAVGGGGIRGRRRNAAAIGHDQISDSPFLIKNENRIIEERKVGSRDCGAPPFDQQDTAFSGDGSIGSPVDDGHGWLCIVCVSPFFSVLVAVPGR